MISINSEKNSLTQTWNAIKFLGCIFVFYDQENRQNIL